MNGDPTICFDKRGWRTTEYTMLHFLKVVNVRKYLNTYILLKFYDFYHARMKIGHRLFIIFLLNVVTMKNCCKFYSYLISFTHGKAKIVWKKIKTNM